MSDNDLYARGTATLLASWEAYAQPSAGAALARLNGAAAIFPTDPERAVYNNTLVHRGLASSVRTAAIDAVEAADEFAGVVHYAAWVHECDAALCNELTSRGYTVAEATRAMGIALDDFSVGPPSVCGNRLSRPGALFGIHADSRTFVIGPRKTNARTAHPHRPDGCSASIFT